VNRKHNLRLPKPLFRHLSDAQAKAFLEVPKHPRDQAMFLLMPRCGLRVEEVAKLCMDAIDFKRRKVSIQNGKWGRARVVCISNDALKTKAEERDAEEAEKATPDEVIPTRP